MVTGKGERPSSSSPGSAVNCLKTSRAERIWKRTQRGRQSRQKSSAKRATKGTHRSRTAPRAGLPLNETSRPPTIERSASTPDNWEIKNLGQRKSTVEVDREISGASDDSIEEIQPSSLKAEVPERNRTRNSIQSQGRSKGTPVAGGRSGSDRERPGRRKKLTQTEPPSSDRSPAFSLVQGIHGEGEEDVVGEVENERGMAVNSGGRGNEMEQKSRAELIELVNTLKTQLEKIESATMMAGISMKYAEEQKKELERKLRDRDLIIEIPLVVS
ncbi:hypothetical protein FGB62_257g01 [Gracilaria domingensis]|nr:hypothetical protein FGB62_257g01 [Gracilaria domingensis]